MIYLAGALPMAQWVMHAALQELSHMQGVNQSP